MSGDMKPSEALRTASELPYTSEHYARNAAGVATQPTAEDAVCFCAIGAIARVRGVPCHEVEDYSEVEYLAKASRIEAVTYSNASRTARTSDDLADSPAERGAWWQRAIALAEAEEAAA